MAPRALPWLLGLALLAAACGGGGSSPPACEPPLASCDGGCVDTATDASHCGTCGNACPEDHACQGGSCVLAPCPGALVRCAGTCVDLQTSTAHCGACDAPCDPSLVCSAGACAPPPCPAGLSRCGADCVDLLLDEANCGGCGLACPGTRCVLGACPAVACAGVLGLPGPPSLLAGESPVAVAAGDLDGDGVVDLVAAGATGGVGEARAFLGFGFGAFEPFGLTTLPAVPSSASLGSIDPSLDAFADLAVALRTPADGVRIYLGDGMGSFLALPAANAGSVGAYPRVALLADLDLDGDADLLVGTAPEGAPPGSPNVRILHGDGTGTFGAGSGLAPRPPSLSFTAGGDPASGPNGFAVADVDLDGTLDVAVSHALGITAIFRGPSGVFRQAVEIPTPRRALGVAAADLDGNGWPDLAAGDPEGNGIFVALGSASGLGGATALSAGLRPVAIAAADLDLDGRPELLTADEGGGTVTVLRNASPSGLVIERASFVAGAVPGALAVAPLDGDPFPDAAIVDAAGNATALLGDGAAGLRGPRAFPAGSGAALVLFHADGGAPAALDAAVADRAGDAIVFRAGAGDGTFGPASALSLPSFSEPIALASADLDGDGSADLAAALLGAGKVAVLWGDGAGGFSAPAFHPAGLLAAPSGLAAIDADGALGIDLVLSSAGSDEIVLLPSSGPRSFGGPVATPVCGSPAGLAVGRLDADGLDDVLVACGDGRVAVLLRDPAAPGAFRLPVILPAAAGANAVALGDLDGDGDLDAAVTAGGAGAVVLLLNDGAGGLAAGVSFPACAGATGPAVGDVDGDGIPDLAIACPGRGATAVLRALGGGSFRPPLLYATGGLPRAAALGDLDGDGRPEVASANDRPASAAAGGGLAVQRAGCLE